MEVINSLLNEMILDDDIKLKDYQHGVSVALSLGFTFGDNFKII